MNYFHSPRTCCRIVIFLLIIPALIIISSGCRKAGEDAEVIEIEEVTDFTGRLLITFPSGESQQLTVGEKLIEFPHHTLIEVQSGELVGVLLGNTIIVKSGQTARIVLPVVSIEKLIHFTGTIKIILPTGEEITVEAGEPLPDLPPGTRIEVISGELTALSADKRIKLKEGEVARIKIIVEEESPISGGGDISPASPFAP